jgi:hypothetical protein
MRGYTKRYRNKPNRLSDSEVMITLIAFHLTSKLVSYSRFVELWQRELSPMAVMLFRKMYCISFVDSTTLDVCNINRE